MSRLVHLLMTPGVRLMQNLRLPYKLALLSVVLGVPLALLFYFSLTNARSALEYVRTETEGSRAVRGLLDLAHALQLQQLGDAQAAQQLKASRAAFDQLSAQAGTLALRPIWESVGARLDDEKARDQSRAALRVALHDVGEQSGLLFDPDAASYLLMEIGIERIEPLGAALAGTGPLPEAAEQRTQARLMAADIAQKRSDLRMRLESVRRAGEAPGPAWAEVDTALATIEQQLQRPAAADAPDDSGSGIVAARKAAVDKVWLAGIDGMRRVEELLEQRRAKVTTQLAWELGVMVAGALALSYLALAFLHSFGRSLRQLLAAMESFARGDLSCRVEVAGRDEVANIAAHAELVADKLSNIVSEIRSSAMRLSQTGEMVASSAATLADRSEKQAADLVSTAGTVDQLSQAVEQNAVASNALDAMTSRLLEDAQASGRLMSETGAAMSELESGSRRAGEIVGVIDNIAFQTRLLALNAAVEAARAGPAGAGFAVVATEVRHLAQRSSHAAGEVRTLLAETGQLVSNSSRRLRDAGTAISGLVKGVHDVSEALRTISHNSMAQSSDLSAVAKSVGNLDLLTRQNQEMVNQSTSAALDLMDRAGALSSDVAAIRLRQGSADEARNLVERAQSLIQRRGLQAGLAEIRSRPQEYSDRDLYLFAADGQGCYILHCAKPHLEGTRVADTPGYQGDAELKNAREAAEGNHWVDYDIINPATGKRQRKTSYVVSLGDGRFLGCGFYRHVLNAETVE